MTKFALTRPITIIMISFALCLLGVISWGRLPVQLLPQFILPEVYISAGIAGANPEKIEKDLVLPIEEEIATLEGVHEIESTVFSNFTNIKVKFDHGTNMKFAVLKLQQKMTAVENRIPEDVQIEVNKFDTADLSSFLMEISIRGDASLAQLRETAEKRVLRRLEQIDGVVNVGIGGGDKRNLGIEVDADRCEALGIRVDLVQQKINAYHRQPQHLGRVIMSGKMMDVVLLGRIDNLHDLKNLIIRPQGMVRLKDVAKVDYSQEEQTRLYRVNGKPQVGIFIQKDNSSNMLKVAEHVNDEIAAINKDLVSLNYELKVNFSQAEMIQTAIDRIKKLALTGAILAIVILFLFLRNLRFVSILMTAIPISLLVTFNLMYGFDLSINILSLVGLALAIGMLVDNGIVVMENIFLQHQAGKSPHQAALSGTKGVSRSILAATGTTILVFLPVLFVESEAKLFIRELSLSVIFPLAVSLIISLTLIPMIATRALKGKPFKPFRSGRIYEIYRLLLKSAIRHRIRTISAVSILLLLSIFIGLTFIISQAPPPPSARMNLYVSTPKGTTLEVTDEAVRRIEAQMLELKDIDEVRANIRAEEANIVATFLDADQRTEKLNLDKNKDKIRKQNERIENVDLSFDRPRRAGSSGGGSDGISDLLTSEEGLLLKGYDLQGLNQISNQITGTLKGIPEIDDESVVSDLQGGAPELQVIGDRMRLALWGLNMQNIMTAIWSTRSEGTRASTPYYSENGEVNMQLLLANIEERRLDDIGKIRVMNAAGQFVPLNQVAKIRLDEGTGNIIRANQERQVKITYKFIKEVQNSKSGQEMAKAQIDRFISELRLPKGFSIEKLETENVRAPYYWMLAIGFLLIYMFLAAQFESLSMPIIILGTVPTAVIGSLFALVITGTPLSLGESAPMALLGLIVLLGIVVNNGIILLDRIAILRTQHHYRWQRAVIIAGQSRVRPILMTSATTILGLFPLALKQGTELELWPPFAITVIGGLLVSTLSTLVFIPVLYVGLEQTKAWLKKIGWIGILLGSLATAASLYWIYNTYQSKIYTILLFLPIWFSILGFIYSIKHFLFVRQEKAKLSTQKFTIRIKNLTKIYGAPGRFVREWNREKRRVASTFAMGQMPWENEGIYQAAVWLVTILIFIVYLHTFLSSSFWLIVLSLLNLICIFSARTLWYKWRFVNGKPPKPKKNIKWPFIKKKVNRESPSTEEITLLNFPKRGGIFIYLAFLAYIPLRTGSTAWSIIVLVFTLMLFQFYRIGKKIKTGQIDPEQPKGKLKKIKRGVYAVTKFIPFIRPPKHQVVALKGVSINIGHGMFGLLGPNGAGKTTLMRILVGVLEADHGSIKINESLLKDHRTTFHGSIGYLPQDFGLYENMTPLEYLNYHALMNNIYEEKEREELIEHTLKSVGIWDRKDAKIKTFSGGMKQRVGIAQTLLHLPQIIVVDEPTAGLDPKQRIKFRNLLADLAKDRIVIFSTHIVEDIASTCHDMAVLNKGEVVFNGSPKEMQSNARGKVFEAIIDEERFSEMQKKLKIVQHSKLEDKIRMRFLSEQEIDGLDAKSVEPTLEDAYVLLLQGKLDSNGNGHES